MHGILSTLSWPFGWRTKCFGIPVKDDHFPSKCDVLLIYLAVPVFDLYTSDEKLWKALLSRVERWHGSRSFLAAIPSLLRAGRLLHKTNSSKSRYKLTTPCAEKSN
jgi:hypothetical protein